MDKFTMSIYYFYLNALYGMILSLGNPNIPQ
jgi:hypothetical protein